MQTQTDLTSRFAAIDAATLRLRKSTASERIARLHAIERAVLRHEEEIVAALGEDLGKPREEVLATDIAPVVIELRTARRNLSSWMKPRRTDTPLVLFGTRSSVVPESKGPSLIIAPWNYPFTLTLGPLASAVSAGCPIILKPSEKAPRSAEVLERILAAAFPPEEVCVCRGGPEIARGLLELPFRHIYFTGGPRTGREVMTAAAKHLASVTLELGGKSPAVVDASANIEKAARKIAFGKFSNAGQTCLAPDYVLVHESIREQFEHTLAEMTSALYGATDRVSDRDSKYCRIVSKEHAARLAGLLDDAVSRGAVPLTGGDHDIPGRFVAPTVLSGVTLEFRLMQEEIFGPILPVLGYRTEDELHAIVARNPSPLTAYVFARDRAFIERTLRLLQAGSCVVNETLLQFANAHLPFGGVGPSGMGRGHGQAGFLSFSNEKAVLKRWTNSWLLRRIQPPYTKRTLAWLRALIRIS